MAHPGRREEIVAVAEGLVDTDLGDEPYKPCEKTPSALNFSYVCPEPVLVKA